MTGGRPIMAFTVTITAPRPGKGVRAIRAPSGMPSRAAQATALRLTASDSRTMASSAGSPVSRSWSADAFSAMDVLGRAVARRLVDLGRGSRRQQPGKGPDFRRRGAVGAPFHFAVQAHD